MGSFSCPREERPELAEGPTGLRALAHVCRARGGLTAGSVQGLPGPHGTPERCLSRSSGGQRRDCVPGSQWESADSFLKADVLE